MLNKFNIEYFNAKNLKKSNEKLNQILKEVEKVQKNNKIYTKAFSFKNTLWDKIKKLSLKR